MAISPERDLTTISSVVDKLKGELEYVHTFAIVLKSTENRRDLKLSSLVDLYRRIFGKTFFARKASKLLSLEDY